MNVSRGLVGRLNLPILARNRILNVRRFSDKKTESTETPKVYEKPAYATRARYQENIMASRVGREATAETGVMPTGMQRLFLVITGLFRNRKEIPQYVPNSTMQRMHDRLRVVFIVTGTIIFFSIFLIMEMRTGAKIERDKAEGKVVTRMP